MLSASARYRFYPAAKAVVAAVLFGASAPLAKVLLRDVEPVPLAGFLYLGCGLGAALALIARRRSAADHPEGEARLVLPDLPWLAAAILAGGVAAPIVLMLSLRATPAATASLLLNFEGVATTILAALAFREAVGLRVWSAVALITVASILLSLNLTGGWGFSLAALGVLLACTLWGLDNNLTRNLSAKDPVAIVAAKGLCAGSFSLLLALALQSRMPSPDAALKAMLLGSVSYGLSIVLFILALRDLGAARTSVLYGAAPFLGTLLAVLVFGERPGAQFLLALPLMLAGAAQLLREDHRHLHDHQVVVHEHSHRHDDLHHTHPHLAGALGESGQHSHPHRHTANPHEHPHAPDLHHRHGHSTDAADDRPDAH